jgi:hypothetical protein
MRLALQNRSNAEPTGFSRWIEFFGAGTYQGVTQFLPFHEPGNIEHRTLNIE